MNEHRRDASACCDDCMLRGESEPTLTSTPESVE